MIGNRVRVYLTDGSQIVGVLHKLDEAGAILWRDAQGLSSGASTFIPMHRIYQIDDLGRTP